jgi:hypothetical protein
MPSSFYLGSSSISLGSRKKKKKKRNNDDKYDNDDWSVTTFATDSPLKYKEAFKRYRPKAQVSREIPKICDAREEMDNSNTTTNNNDNNVETLADSRDATESKDIPNDEVRILHRSMSFQSLKKKMEKLTMKAFQPRNQLHRTLESEDYDSLTTYSDNKSDPQGENDIERSFQEQEQTQQLPWTNVVSQNEFRQQSLMNTNQHVGLLASSFEGTTGCNTSESQLQSGLLMESITLKLKDLTPKAKKSLQPLSSSSSPAEFLNVLSDELQATRTKMPRGHDELLLFLGDELNASTCGGFPSMYNFEDDKIPGMRTTIRRQRLVPIMEGGAIEEMLESIEMGYEASLIGCGMTQ